MKSFRKHSSYVKMSWTKKNERKKTHLPKSIANSWSALLFDSTLRCIFLCWKCMRAFVPVCGTTKIIASKADAEFYVWLHNCCKWWFGRECEVHAKVSFFSASDAPAYIICSMILVERFHYLCVSAVIRLTWDLIRRWSLWISYQIRAMQCNTLVELMCSVFFSLLLLLLFLLLAAVFFVSLLFAHEHMPSNCLRLSSLSFIFARFFHFRFSRANVMMHRNLLLISWYFSPLFLFFCSQFVFSFGFDWVFVVRRNIILLFKSR